MTTTTTTKLYELTVLMDELAEQSQIDELTKKIRKYGKITGGGDDGIKRLACPIRNHEKARFLYYTLDLEDGVPAELSGDLCRDDASIRHLLVRVSK